MGGLLKQLAGFGVVGFAAFGIDYGLLMLLTQVFAADPMLSAAVAFCVSLAFNYLASMRFVFTHRADLSRTREFSIFLVLSAIGLIINEAVMWAGLALLGDTALSISVVKVAATAVVMVWNFLSRKKWLDAGARG